MLNVAFCEQRLYAKMAVTYFGSDNTVFGAVAFVASGLRRLLWLYGPGRLLDCRRPGRLADAGIPRQPQANRAEPECAGFPANSAVSIAAVIDSSFSVESALQLYGQRAKI